MKYKVFIYTLLPLMFVFNLFILKQSQAKPQSIFQPIIKDIEARLPSGLELRLPTFIPTFSPDATLYSFLPDEDSKIAIALDDDLEMEFFTVLIANTPNCGEQKNPQDCLVGAVGVTEDPIKSATQLNSLLAKYREDITEVKFKPGIKGVYFTERDMQSVIWRQNKMAHLLLTEKCDNECISKQELIEMAKSAAKEPAIVNSNSSYYSY